MRPMQDVAVRGDVNLKTLESEDLPDLFEMVETSIAETTGEWQPYESVEDDEAFAEQLSNMIAHSLVDEF